VAIMGKMPMPRQASTESLSSSSLRLGAFALPSSCFLPSPALAGYPPETEAIPSLCLSAAIHKFGDVFSF